MEIKALILAGGRGKRLEKVASNTNKCILPFNGKPLICYSIENAYLANVSEIVIVVGYRAEDIINEIGIVYKDLRIKYVIQKEQKGLVNAIECAREMIEGANFMTFLGDEILVQPRHHKMVQIFRSKPIFTICGVTEARRLTDVSKTYAVIEAEDSRIFRLVEKPRKPFNNTMGTGNCIFQNDIFDYIERTPINQMRGEKELPDLIQCAIDEGRTVVSFNIGSGYLNINTENEISEAEALFRNLMTKGGA